ncbi:DNA-binding transcriptional regulator YbjK [Spinactinospora alkalitolerans]|uniref:DNA-binding transcriptional regulator YbjK n=1 Tax=Spinactinospora alkalitolerans TaxID=687207 RepID=A0A852U072_9ACTN|nr:TetR family transcriptional regulator [Spinactinospora alkalitolerans]NYE50216.1 DNA-binding transcriptional regulator YbjK [Spinactinospora alkalitolerans]
MPPPNPRRRDRLAGAAIEVLAREGSHGLTHRAVDAAAEAPPGTTSRYFRTRAALVNGVVDRVTRRLADRIDGNVVQPIDPAGLEDALVTVLRQMLSADRSQPMALLELHLEGSRDPHLRDVLADAMTARRDLIIRQCRAAGIDVSAQDALQLEMTVMGILFTALTVNPQAFDDLDVFVRTAVRSTLARYLPENAARYGDDDPMPR